MEIESHSTKTKCCGCSNLTSIVGEKVSAIDLSLVEWINLNNKKDSKSVLSKEDLQYQEARRNRKVRKLDFDIR